MDQFEKEMKSKAMQIIPEIQIGKNGLTESLVGELKHRFEKRSLIKIKVHPTFQADRARIAEKLALDCNARVIETKGNTIVLYNPKSKKTKEKQVIQQGRKPKRQNTTH
ncbi:MAG: YhbY family RNA-binding protein [Candidatus Diapherotrites archaeon]|nr:YhbY family RNA-binding protein [Candidatus Diapherotrites archaeon]